MTTRCDTCGAEYGIGQWYRCPHGSVSGTVIDDQIEGGPRFFDHLGHEPVWIETKTQLQAELDKRGLRLMDRWAGESDRHLSNWAAAIDPYTLESARVLLSRGSGGRAAASSPETAVQSFRSSVRAVKLSEL